MKHKIGLALMLCGLSAWVNAADPLNGTVWKTIDDKTNKPKAVVKFAEQGNGTLTATIQSVLDPAAAKVCQECKGVLQGKPMVGLTIVHDLKNAGGQSYAGGTILDPKTGKTYRLKAELKNEGKVLNLRGYLGISALGRNQTWQRLN